MKGKILKRCLTNDGHKATVHVERKPLLIFTKRYRITIYSKTTKDEVIHCYYRMSEANAIADAQNWNMNDYLDYLMKSHNVSI